MYGQVLELALAAGSVSTSHVQRSLRIGYSRAARLVDLLEENGVIGPASGSGPRKVIGTGTAPDAHMTMTPSPGNVPVPLPMGLGTPSPSLPEIAPRSFFDDDDETPKSFLPVGIKKGEYHQAYCDHIIQYFDKPKKREVRDYFTYKSGAESEKVRYVANTPPMFSAYARSIGINTKTLEQWGMTYPEFGEALGTCQEIFEEFLIENGLTGEYGAIFAKFVAVNKTRMRDKSEHTEKKVDINKALDQIAAGELRPGGLLPAGDDSASVSFHGKL